MTNIYKITNNINGKIYIGVTIHSLEERWRTHVKDSKTERCKDRPLYRAFNKYGISAFSIELIEQIDDEFGFDKERYWIEYYGSFKKGYNATLGGDGKPYIDYDLVVSTYRELKNMQKTADKLGICEDSVGIILKSRKEPILTQMQVNKIYNGTKVDQYSLDGEYIQSFQSTKDALRTMNQLVCGGNTSRITNVCKGKGKTAFGYIWKYNNS